MYSKFVRLGYRALNMLDSIAGRGGKVEMSSFIGFYRRLWKEAADSLGAEFSDISEDIWEIRHGGRVTLIHNYKVQLDDPVVMDIAGDKALCSRLLRDHGLPVPDYVVYRLDELDKARAFMEQYGDGRFVVKPSLDTSGARGITMYVRSFHDCRRASALASFYSTDIILERLIPGESYRLLILGGRMIHATRRRGLRVVGDGTSTLRNLVERKHSGLRLREDDLDFRLTVAAQHLSGDSIPEAGRNVLVRSSALPPGRRIEVRTVFDEDVTGIISKELETTAVNAARVLNSRFAGVDIVTLDPALPLSVTGGAINEVNTTPGLHHHYNLVNSGTNGPAVAVLKYLLGIAGA